MPPGQVMWWIERLRGHIRAGRSAPSYGLLGKKLEYGVDYGMYMHQVCVHRTALAVECIAPPVTHASE